MNSVSVYVRSMEAEQFAGFEARASALGLSLSSGSRPFGRLMYIARLARGAAEVSGELSFLVDPHGGRSMAISQPSVEQMLVLAILVQAGILHSPSRLA